MKLLSSERLHEIILSLSESKNLFIAFSGGLDSHVLLHALSRVRAEHSEFNLTAIHINHNLSSNASKWENHCKEICHQLNIPLVIKQIDAKTKIKGLSPEEIARHLRYEVLAKLLSKDACLVTAHQADDQAETVLLHLFRGSGPKGLSAMSPKIEFASGFLLRPMLFFSRQEIIEYANQNKLKWVEDESNLNAKYSRNFLRLNILSKLKERFPGVVATLNRVAEHSRELDKLLEMLAAQDLEQAKGSVKDTLLISKVLQLDEARQRNLIRYWLKALKFSTPSTVKLQQIQKSLLHANVSAKPKVSWLGCEIRRYKDNMYAMMPLKPHDNKMVIPWNLSDPIKLPEDLGVLRVDFFGTRPEIEESQITVKFRQGGEVFEPSGRQGTHCLKKLFQEWEIPPWLRDRVPLVYYEDELIAVVGYGVVEGFPGVVYLTHE